MALPKLYDRIIWHNNTTPALNEDNLNSMSQAIDDIDDRVIELAGTIMEDVPEIREDLEILRPAIESIEENVEAAAESAEASAESALKSEGYAIGEQDGVEVGPDSEYYQNNAKYYAEIANPPIENTVDFTDIITVTDAINKAAKNVRLKVEAVQDLHGYNNPWVGGTGKNLTSYATSINIPANSQSSPVLFTLTLTQGKTYTFSCKQSATITTSTRNTLKVTTPSSVDRFESTSPDFNPTDLRHKLTFTASESGTYTFGYWYHTASNAATLTEWQVEESSSFTSYEPYENICPITGWSQVQIVRASKNLIVTDLENIKALNRHGTWVDNVFTPTASPNLHFTVNADLSVTISGTNGNSVVNMLLMHPDNNFGIYKHYSDCIISGCDASYSDVIFQFQEYTGSWKNYAIVANGEEKTIGTVDTEICRLHIQVFQNKTVNTTVRPMIRASTFDSTYEKPMGEELTISLNGTIYGGTLDVTSGVLTVNKVGKRLLSSFNWGLATENGRRYSVNYTAISGFPVAKQQNDTYISSHLSPTNIGSNNNPFGVFYISDYWLVICDNNTHFADLPSFKTWLDNEEVYICYELATAQTIQLTAAEVYLLYGYNTLFGDCGDISLTYDASGIIHIEEAKLDTETLKTIAAASSDFADFKARIAAL